LLNVAAVVLHEEAALADALQLVQVSARDFVGATTIPAEAHSTTWA